MATEVIVVLDRHTHILGYSVDGFPVIDADTLVEEHPLSTKHVFDTLPSGLVIGCTLDINTLILGPPIDVEHHSVTHRRRLVRKWARNQYLEALRFAYAIFNGVRNDNTTLQGCSQIMQGLIYNILWVSQKNENLSNDIRWGFIKNSFITFQELHAILNTENYRAIINAMNTFFDGSAVWSYHASALDNLSKVRHLVAGSDDDILSGFTADDVPLFGTPEDHIIVRNFLGLPEPFVGA